jgi:hypothetical protein
MTEIRRIREAEADTVAALWDRMCRETPDGGPLTESGLRAIARMLAAAAWHRDTFCLVAVDGGAVTGFAMGRVDIGDGLLPGVEGLLQETYAPDDGLRRRLVEAALAGLAERGAGVVRCRFDVTDEASRTLLTGFGFEADMILMSRYDTTTNGC